MDIFVGSLPFKLKENELRELFEKYGEVSSAKIIIDKETRQNKGFGFVEMPNDSEALKAIDALNGSEVMGRAIKVNKSEKREPGSGGSSFRGGEGPRRPSFNRDSSGGSSGGGYQGGSSPSRDSNTGGGSFNRDSSNSGGFRRDSNTSSGGGGFSGGGGYKGSNSGGGSSFRDGGKGAFKGGDKGKDSKSNSFNKAVSKGGGGSKKRREDEDEFDY